MKIVFLDSGSVNPGDLSWRPIEELGEFVHYEDTPAELMRARLEGAEAVFVDSFPLSREIMEASPMLKFIGIAATGYNHVDLKAAEELGIAVCNVPVYSAEAVAQHAISLLLALTSKAALYHQAVEEGRWSRDRYPITLLAGKSLGIIGYGAIGKQTARIGEALGMKIHIYSRDPEETIASDVVSLHCPLTEENRGMVDRDFIEQMKEGAILINTARGALVDEEALADALKKGRLAGAGLDVLEKEPPDEDCPLLGVKNCIITPHVGFSPAETRKTVIDTCGWNLKGFLIGERRNRLV